MMAKRMNAFGTVVVRLQRTLKAVKMNAWLKQMSKLLMIIQRHPSNGNLLNVYLIG